ncbi:MAG: toll/interleukin-1 receptor domain-containing protein [Pseudomonadota bacterium]
MTSTTGGNVFVSYSRLNLDFANQVVSLLEDEGYDPLIDRDDIEVTEKWLHRLEELIKSSDTVLFILTDEYLESESCKWEVDKSLELGKRLIPVLPKPLVSKDVPPALASLNYIHFFNLREGDGTGFYAGTRALRRALRHDLERLRLQRRFEDRAAGWNAGEDDLLSGEQLVQAEAWLRNVPPEEGIPEAISTYISASRAAENKRLRNRRRWTFAFAALGIGALVATGFAGVAWFQAQTAQTAARDAIEQADITQAQARDAQLAAQAAQDELLTAEDDAVKLAEAADLWARGSRAAAQTPWGRAAAGGSDIDPIEETEGLLQRAFTYLSGVSQKDSLHIWQISRAVTRDLAETRYHAGKDTAFELIDGLLSTPVNEETVPADFLANDMPSILAELHALRAVYACPLAAERELIFDRIVAVDDDVKASLTWSAVADLERAPSGICYEARAAICDYAIDCPIQTRALASIEPEPVIVTGPAPDAGSDVIINPRTEPKAGAVVPAPTQIAKKDPFQITELYLHISSEDQRPRAEEVAKLLISEGGYKVLGIELIEAPPGKNRSVRYNFDVQEDQAIELANMCAEFAGDLGFQAWAERGSYRTISLDGRYKGLRPNRAEIWF